MNVVLMQMQKFFHEYSHGDLTANVLSLKSFVLYGTTISHFDMKSKALLDPIFL